MIDMVDRTRRASAGVNGRAAWAWGVPANMRITPRVHASHRRCAGLRTGLLAVSSRGSSSAVSAMGSAVLSIALLSPCDTI